MNVGKLLNRSLDMKYYLSQTLIIGAVSLGFYVLVLILMFTAEGNDMLRVYAVLYALIMLPFFGFFVYRMVDIKHVPDRYRLLEGVAIEMCPSFARRMYLVMEITAEDGSTFTAKTNGIFSLSVMSHVCYSEYYQERLQVLWDVEGERLVVVGKREI